MVTKTNTYTSTGMKLLRQGKVIDYWNCQYPIPQSLQVALTEHCTLKCSFCSVANREKKYVFNYDNLVMATDEFIKLGTQTVEITGGGDPLCYPKLNDYLKYLYNNGMKVGMITNSIGLGRCVDKELLQKLSWLRISANVLDYKDDIEVPKDFQGTLGFSYVWTDEHSNEGQLIRIRDIARRYGAKYVRLVPNCLSTKAEQEQRNNFLEPLAKKIGSPVFFQRKDFATPDNCYWGYIKPFLYCDEYVYPCSSTVLNEDADKQFNTSYRWCHWSEVEATWRDKEIASAVDTKRCEHCVFTEQNKMLEYALTQQEHEDFV